MWICRPIPVHYDQAEYDLRCEWGLAGAQVQAPISDVLIVVDVLVFSTAVDIAVAIVVGRSPWTAADALVGPFSSCCAPWSR
jgi:hypothetical protein